MISRYSDHAANERTFLAWARTAIAVIAFGFLVERFDLFLEVASSSLARQPPSPGAQVVAEATGLLLIALGGAMLVAAILRFRQIGRDIDAAEARPLRGTGVEITLVSLLLGLGATLFIYLLVLVLRRVA